MALAVAAEIVAFSSLGTLLGAVFWTVFVDALAIACSFKCRIRRNLPREIHLREPAKALLLLLIKERSQMLALFWHPLIQTALRCFPLFPFHAAKPHLGVCRNCTESILDCCTVMEQGCRKAGESCSNCCARACNNLTSQFSGWDATIARNPSPCLFCLCKFAPGMRV